MPPAYFTTPSNLLPRQPVSEQMRKDLTALPASVAEVDMLVCDSFPRPPGDVSLWFSLRYAEATTDASGLALGSSRVEPNLLDTGFTFMYYPPPANITNEFVTGGPLKQGGPIRRTYHAMVRLIDDGA